MRFQCSGSWEIPSNFRALKLLRIATGEVAEVPPKGSFTEGVGRQWLGNGNEDLDLSGISKYSQWPRRRLVWFDTIHKVSRIFIFYGIWKTKTKLKKKQWADITLQNSYFSIIRISFPNILWTVLQCQFGEIHHGTFCTMWIKVFYF